MRVAHPEHLEGEKEGGLVLVVLKRKRKKGGNSRKVWEGGVLGSKWKRKKGRALSFLFRGKKKGGGKGLSAL